VKRKKEIPNSERDRLRKKRWARCSALIPCREFLNPDFSFYFKIYS
jgi:hypothetical protein